MPGVVIIQQCVDSAKLLINNVDEWIEIGRGVIYYVAFTKEATAASVERAVAELVEAVLVPSPNDPATKVTLLEAQASVLVVPQASLAGKLKNHKAQYHALIDKQLGSELYHLFVKLLRDTLEKGVSEGKVQNGTYGNRQALNLVSSGPNTHQFDF